jgi:hypothetical protein
MVQQNPRNTNPVSGLKISLQPKTHFQARSQNSREKSTSCVVLRPHVRLSAPSSAIDLGLLLKFVNVE